MNIIELQTFLQACMHRCRYNIIDLQIKHKFVNMPKIFKFATLDILRRRKPSCFVTERCVCSIMFLQKKTCVSIIKLQDYGMAEWERDTEREGEEGKRGRRKRKRESEEKAKKRKGERRICPSGMDVAPELTEFSQNFKKPRVGRLSSPTANDRSG